MEQREYTTHDRTNWGSGPWDGEPDKVQFVDEATKLPCLAVRNHHGAWCGYVGVPPGHKFFEVPYRDLSELDVHGGLTFADHCRPAADESHGICHIRQASSQIRDELTREVREAVKPYTETIKSTIKEELVNAIRKVV